MASNYVDTTSEEVGRFHHGTHSSGTTPTGAAASSPRTMRRSFSSASSGGGGTAKCVCAPATHAGSFKCRLHRTNSQGHGGHPHPSPPTSPAGAAAAAPQQGSAASRTVEAQ